MVDLDDDVAVLCSLLCLLLCLFCDGNDLQESENKKREINASLRKTYIERSYKRHRKKRGKADKLGDSSTQTCDFESDCPQEKTENGQVQIFLLFIVVLMSNNISFHLARKQDNEIDSCGDAEDDDCTKIECVADSDECKQDKTAVPSTLGHYSYPNQNVVSKLKSVNSRNEDSFFGYGSKCYKGKKKKQFLNHLVDIIGWHVDTFTSYIMLPLLRQQQDYSRYFHRLGSFCRFPETVNVLGLTLRLARSGFYYTGDGRTNDVTCYYCNLNINWNETDDPDVKHHELSPLCPRNRNAIQCSKHHVNPGEGRTNNFRLSCRRISCNGYEENSTRDMHSQQHSGRLLPGTLSRTALYLKDRTAETGQRNGGDNIERYPEEESSNVNQEIRPLGATGGIPTPTTDTNDVQRAVHLEKPKKKNNHRLRDNGSSQAGDRSRILKLTISLRQQQGLTDDELPSTLTGRHQQGATFRPSPLGICREQPKFPVFSALYQRISSFGGTFPMHQSPSQLAKAGFFYTGINDNVQCFFCGGGLRNWERGDDPWVRHAQWFPHCVYLRMTKGDTFVMRISSLFSGNCWSL